MKLSKRFRKKFVALLCFLFVTCVSCSALIMPVFSIDVDATTQAIRNACKQCPDIVQYYTNDTDSTVTLAENIGKLIDSPASSEEIKAGYIYYELQHLYESPRTKTFQSAMKYYAGQYIEKAGGINGSWSVGAYNVELIANGAEDSLNIVKIYRRIANSVFNPDTGQTGEFWNAVSKVTLECYNALKVIGIMLVLIYFIVDILERLKADNINSDQMMRKFLTLAIGILFVMFGYELFVNVWHFSEKLIDVFFVNNSTLSSTLYADIWLKWAVDCRRSMLEAILSALTTFFIDGNGMLTQLVCVVLMYGIVYSRMLKIITRLIFAPIGISNVFSIAHHDAGLIYLKKFAAVCLQAAAIAVIMVATSYVRTGFAVSGSFFDDFLSAVLVPVAAIAASFKSMEICNDVVGVH